ncbi:MAG TPA: hypothetical protein V6D33_00440 [Cyanophyceae cyanobacterium]
MISQEQTAEILQEYEEFFSELESSAILAIASNDWTQLYDLIAGFQNQLTLEALETAIQNRKTNTVDLRHPGVGLVQNTNDRTF